MTTGSRIREIVYYSEEYGKFNTVILLLLEHRNNFTGSAIQPSQSHIIHIRCLYYMDHYFSIGFVSF